MKHKNFEDFLMDYHCKTHPMILDDDLPDAYDDWLCNLEPCDWVDFGDKYLKEQVGDNELLH